MGSQEQIQKFLAGKRFAVVGASQDREKYGNKVLRVYQQNGFEVVPVNPTAKQIEGLSVFTDLQSIPGNIDGVSIITRPGITEQVVQDALEKGIKHIWMQPGAESERSVSLAEKSGANVISGGACILVALRFRDDAQAASE